MFLCMCSTRHHPSLLILLFWLFCFQISGHDHSSVATQQGFASGGIKQKDRPFNRMLEALFDDL